MIERQDKNTIVFIEGKYVLSFDSHNWIVSEINKRGTNGIKGNLEDLIDSKTNSYHSNIQQAIIAMSNRMLKDNISNACKNRIIELRELVTICKEKDRWMRKAIMGRGEMR